MNVSILPVKRRVRNCRQCGAHFFGHHWQRWCRVCWSWRMAAWHVTAAARALKVRE